MTFKVSVQPSNRQFSVDRDEPVLAAALRQGIGLPYGCRDGACGSCKCRLIEGRVIHGAHQARALSAAEEDAGWMLSCCAAPQTDLVIEARTVAGVGDFPARKMPARVMSLERPAPDVAIVRLQLPANDALRYRAGQFIEVLLANGARRSYSMANAPEALGNPPAIELHIRHLPGGLFSDAVFHTMKPKDILRIEGPLGTFFLREESARPVLLLAAGTGFAPIKAIVEHMRLRGITRPTWLYWGCRREVDLYLHDWAVAAAAELPWLRYVPVLSEAGEADGWGGRTGLVHQAAMADLPDLAAHEVYACGAPAMIDAARRDYAARGLPEDAFFADAFTTAAAA